MIQSRTIKRLPQGADQELVVVTLETQDCPPKGAQSRIMVSLLMNQLANHQELTHCEDVAFEKLAIFHNGRAWIAEARALIDKPRST